MQIKYQIWSFWGWGRMKTIPIKLNADGCIGVRAQKKWLAMEKEIEGKKHKRSIEL